MDDGFGLLVLLSLCLHMSIYIRQLWKENEKSLEVFGFPQTKLQSLKEIVILALNIYFHVGMKEWQL